MSQPQNLRFVLRAYETVDTCRLASILLELTAGGTLGVTRKAIVARWAVRYPRHATQPSTRTIRKRIGNALTHLKVAQIARSQDAYIEVANLEWLTLSAGNLAILEGITGVAIRPAYWSRRPDVPEYLLAVQAPIEESRQQAAQAARGE